MHYSKTALVSGLMILFYVSLLAQPVRDTSQNEIMEFEAVSFTVNQPAEKTNDRFFTRSLFVPAFLIAYGFSSMEMELLEDINIKLNKEMFIEAPHKKVRIDNYLQYAPAAAVYALNALGIKGKHNFRDRTIIYLMSNVFVTATVCGLKNITNEQRPDGSAFNSFPSGHTTAAFASAEFLRQEYKDVSAWYGYAGYAVAFATGYLRMYNNRHWLSDVMAGAGIGILSTKLAYWLYPKIQQKLFKGKNPDTIIMPAYENKAIGFSMVHKF